MMKIELNTEETKNLIEKYYEEKKERANVSFTSSIQSVDFYGNEEAYGEIILKKEINLLGMKKETEETLSKEEVLGILNEMLKDAGFIVKSLKYDTGISQGGDYIWESTGKTAYFRGLKLEVEKLKNVVKRIHY